MLSSKIFELKLNRIRSLVAAMLSQLERFLQRPHRERELLGAVEEDQAKELAACFADLDLIVPAEMLRATTSELADNVTDIGLSGLARKSADYERWLREYYGDFPPPGKGASQHRRLQRERGESVVDGYMKLADWLRGLQADLQDGAQSLARPSDKRTGAQTAASEPSELTKEPGGARLNAVEQWEGATKATKRANRLTDVERDWASYWRGYCEKHGVSTRPARKKDDTLATGRCEVELGSLLRTIVENPEEFEKATPEIQKRRLAIRAKIEREHGLNSELLEELRAPE